MHPFTKRQFGLAVAATSLLAACGGSSDDLRSKDLYAGYEVVGEGQTFPQGGSVHIGARTQAKVANNDRLI